MRTTAYTPVILAVVLGFAACLGAAIAAVGAIEDSSAEAVETALGEAGHDWAGVGADGLRVVLTGTAPDEAARFNAISQAGTVVDASRIVDGMTVTEAPHPDGPDFRVEMLRNEDGISLIGLVPVETDRLALFERLGRIETDGEVTDLLESADYPVPDAWQDSLEFAVSALELLPQSKISAEAGMVSVTAITASAEDKRRIEARLREDTPNGVTLTAAISAPRPVITPFTIRFTLDGEGARLEACSAETEESRAAILTAAREAGASDGARCRIGLGQPSSTWSSAVVRAIGAVSELGGGVLVFSDADISLTARPGTAQGAFDRIAAELESDLPEVFSLTAILPEPEDGTREAPDGEAVAFVATRSPEGLTQLRGRLPDGRTRAAVTGYAQSRFGAATTDIAVRLDPDLPEGWPLRVLSALEALSLLNNGMVRVEPASIVVRGNTGDPDAQAEIAGLLARRLGESEAITLDVTYVEALDPVAALPTPEECVADLNSALATRKITFEPGSTTIDADALETIDRVADVLRECQTVQLEIGGHTDSQGRESMNLRLSQQRADAVLNAIMSRRVLTENLTAKGYGETQPIADNGTEEGREANRRIEFRLTPLDAGETEEETASEQN